MTELKFIENSVCGFGGWPKGEFVEDQKLINYSNNPGGAETKKIGYRLYTILDEGQKIQGSINSILRSFVRVIDYYKDQKVKDRKGLMNALLSLRAGINLYYSLSGFKPSFLRRNMEKISVDNLVHEIIMLGTIIDSVQQDVRGESIQKSIVHSSLILRDFILMEGFTGGVISHYPSQVNDIAHKYQKGYYVFDPCYSISDINQLSGDSILPIESEKNKSDGLYLGFSIEFQGDGLYLIMKNGSSIAKVRGNIEDCRREVRTLIKGGDNSKLVQKEKNENNNQRLFYGSHKYPKTSQGRRSR